MTRIEFDFSWNGILFSEYWFWRTALWVYQLLIHPLRLISIQPLKSEMTTRFLCKFDMAIIQFMMTTRNLWTCISFHFAITFFHWNRYLETRALIEQLIAANPLKLPPNTGNKIMSDWVVSTFVPISIQLFWYLRQPFGSHNSHQHRSLNILPFSYLFHYYFWLKLFLPPLKLTRQYYRRTVIFFLFARNPRIPWSEYFACLLFEYLIHLNQKTVSLSWLWVIVLTTEILCEEILMAPRNPAHFMKCANFAKCCKLEIPTYLN